MNLKLLRIIRLTAFVLIFVLAGFYASLLLLPKSEPPSKTQPVVVDRPVTLPEIILSDIGGKPRSIDEFTGRPLLINFWATWCAPCLREMPMFETLWQERKVSGGLQIIGIAIDRAADVEEYLERTTVTYPILIGQSDAMEVAGSFGPDFAGLPFTVFAAPDGQILLLHAGELNREQLDDILSTIDAVAAGSMSITAARARLAG